MKRTLYSGVGLLLVGLLFLAFNLLSSLLLRDQQFDLTQQKLYTFSAGTQEVLDSLDEPLNLYLFFSKSRASDLPALRNYARRVEEVLDLYARRSHGNVRLFVIDPLPFSDDEDRAARFGLQALPIGTNGEAIYFGLAATDATDGLQVIPFFSPEEEPLLEYDLSRLVQALAQRERTVVGLMSSLPMTGQAPTDGQSGSRPWAMMDKLYQQFDIRTLGLASTEIPADISVLMLVHPRQLSEQTQYAIDQFVLRGGKLLAFVDPSESRRCGRRERLRPGPVAAFLGRPVAAGYPAGGCLVRHDQTQRRTSPGAQSDLAAPPRRHVPPRQRADHRPGKPQPRQRRPARTSRRSLDALHSVAAQLGAQHAAVAGALPPILDGAAQRHPGPDRRTLRAGRQGRGAGDECLPADRGKQGEGLTDSANIHVLLVADTDLLSNPLWLQEQPGHNEPQVWADNDLFVGNALDYLSGSDALIDLRSRGHTKRPFTRVEALRREAGMRAQEQLNALQQSLNDTDKNLRALQQSMDDGGQEVTPEMEATLRRFIDDKLRIRQQLRQLQFQLNADVERLAEQVKLANTVLLPALLTLLLLLHWSWRSMRRRRG